MHQTNLPPEEHAVFYLSCLSTTSDFSNFALSCATVKISPARLWLQKLIGYVIMRHMLNDLRLLFADSLQQQKHNATLNSLSQTSSAAICYLLPHSRHLTLQTPLCSWHGLSSFPKHQYRTRERSIERIQTLMYDLQSLTDLLQCWPYFSYRSTWTYHSHGDHQTDTFICSKKSGSERGFISRSGLLPGQACKLPRNSWALYGIWSTQKLSPACFCTFQFSPLRSGLKPRALHYKYDVFLFHDVVTVTGSNF